MQSACVAYERYPGSAIRSLSPSYRRREPEKTALYNIVSRHLEACLEQANEKSAHGYGYPRFIENEFGKFLNCGVLRRGFVRVKCSGCPNEKLVAFSCKGRGICPLCFVTVYPADLTWKFLCPGYWQAQEDICS